MSRASRRVIGCVALGALLAGAPAMIARAADGDGTGELGVADIASLVTPTRGTMVQEEPLPEVPTTVAGDSLIVPENSGTGRRVVYSKGIQRVWLIDENNLIYNTHRVSGRPDAPNYGTYSVYSRSTITCAMKHSDICMRWMVRFAHKGIDNIGFHQIPERNGVPLQSTDQLGLALSGGCVRQSQADALIMWDWAQLGTTVVVVP